MATVTQNFPRTSNARNGVLGIDSQKLATGLGWFSIGLGLTELLAPGTIGKITGLTNHRGVIRGYGLREISSGLSILKSPQAAGPVWSRVAGDVMDLASLGAGLTSSDNNRSRTVGSIAAVLGVTMLDLMCAQDLSTNGGPASAHASVMVNRSPEACYRFWHDHENIPRFMSYVERVEPRGDNGSHWVAKGPGGASVEWDSEIRQDTPDRSIAWRSLPGSDIHHAGTVDFEPAPGRRGTLVRVRIDFDKNAHGGTMANLLGKASEQQLYKDLRRFKQLVETGEVITTEGQSAGRSEGATWLDNIAR